MEKRKRNQRGFDSNPTGIQRIPLQMILRIVYSIYVDPRENNLNTKY